MCVCARACAYDTEADCECLSERLRSYLSWFICIYVCAMWSHSNVHEWRSWRKHRMMDYESVLPPSPSLCTLSAAVGFSVAQCWSNKHLIHLLKCVHAHMKQNCMKTSSSLRACTNPSNNSLININYLSRWPWWLGCIHFLSDWGGGITDEVNGVLIHSLVHL